MDFIGGFIPGLGTQVVPINQSAKPGGTPAWVMHEPPGGWKNQVGDNPGPAKYEIPSLSNKNVNSLVMYGAIGIGAYVVYRIVKKNM